MGINGMEAALSSDYLSPKTKTDLKKRLKKGTPQPLKRHFEELQNWGIDFDSINERMIRTGAPRIPVGHDYYGCELDDEP